jgi:hypothetical protein
MTRTLLALIIAFASPPGDVKTTPAKARAVGTELSLLVPQSTKVYYPVLVSLKDATATTQVKWTITPAPVWKEPLPPIKVEKPDGKIEYIEPVGYRFTGTPGTYHIRALYVDFDAKLFGEVEADAVIVGDNPPPVPPGPDPPGPQPPGPLPPTPAAGMIDLPGFHVLIKYERDKFLPNLSSDEIRILNSESDQSVRAYLKRACASVDGSQGWRMYPVPAEGVSGAWKTPYERKQGALPILVASKNGKGWEGSIAGWTPEKVIAKCKEVEALP